MNVNEGTMSGHVKMMLQPSTWATQVKVFATATYFQVPIYYLNEAKAMPIVPKWHIVKLLDVHSKFCFPDLAGSPQPTSVSHFELVYYSYSHYISAYTCRETCLCQQRCFATL